MWPNYRKKLLPGRVSGDKGSNCRQSARSRTDQQNSSEWICLFYRSFVSVWRQIIDTHWQWQCQKGSLSVIIIDCCCYGDIHIVGHKGETWNRNFQPQEERYLLTLLPLSPSPSPPVHNIKGLNCSPGQECRDTLSVVLGN